MKYLILSFILLTLFSCQKKNFEEQVIKELGLDRKNIKNELIVSSVFPDNESEIILVIPEIESEEIGCCFELNSHILILDSTTGKIKNKYFENAKSNKWFSDILTLTEITIDTLGYQISKNNTAFGIKLKHSNLSKTDPFNSVSVSLFIKSDNTLKKVLKNYDISEFNATINTNCTGKTVKKEKSFVISKNKSKNLNDITVLSKITNTNNYKDSNGGCVSKTTSNTKNTTLQFNGKVYKKHINL